LFCLINEKIIKQKKKKKKKKNQNFRNKIGQNLHPMQRVNQDS